MIMVLVALGNPVGYAEEVAEERGITVMNIGNGCTHSYAYITAPVSYYVDMIDSHDYITVYMMYCPTCFSSWQEVISSEPLGHNFVYDTYTHPEGGSHIVEYQCVFCGPITTRDRECDRTDCSSVR